MPANSFRVRFVLFITMMVWGLNLIAVKLLTETMDILLVAFVRMSLATVVLALLAWRWGKSSNRILDDWKLFAIAGFFLVYLQQISFAGGLSGTSATNAALVTALGPSVSVALEFIAFRRSVLVRQIIGVILSLAGVAAVMLHRKGAGFTSAAIGDILVFASVVSYAVGGLCVQRLTKRHSPLMTSLSIHAVGSTFLLVHVLGEVPNPANQILNLGSQSWSLALFSAVLATGLGSVVWSKSIALIGVGQTATFLSWVPIFGVGFGVLFLAEPLSIWHVVGLLCVVAGSTLASRRN